MCWRFAKDQTEGSRFGDITFTQSSNGCPVLANVIATIDCTVHETQAVGDHDLVVGLITDLRVLDPGGVAMVFFKGKTGDARIGS